jgi:acyl-CoA oxidase
MKEYERRFTGSPVTATYSYLKQLLSSSVPQNPLVTHETDWARLRDTAFLDRTLRYRVARLLQTVAARLQKHMPRVGAFAAWNKCLSHLLALANAHIEWVIFRQFMLAVHRCKDSGCASALKCMADIFALTVRLPIDTALSELRCRTSARATSFACA